ncbi:MAG: glycosyltransferase family 2 protein [Chitinophagaceae bacterium]|nr:MAG: glycosyltransferase family 2 protein [Chitinophagaceae bacterium]
MSLQVSIIIVNYNVKLFLEQCLLSVRNAIGLLQTEIIVVDNCSSDESIEYLSSRFPDVEFISNKENVGFAKACNQGAKQASGNFLLFLNPDTIISENSIRECYDFFEKNNECGATGVRMINGDGEFLRESKRGFPNPAASFNKLMGLSKLFPRSKFFSTYYLGHIKEKENNLVPVLAGAFMMLNRKVWEIIKGFDESFFMYGEDIDLSYRVQQAGYKNYYLGSITITHLKGKSTRGNKKQIDHFYGAMKIFVKKHYSKKKSFLFIGLLHMGIELRKYLAMLSYYVCKCFSVSRNK